MNHQRKERSVSEPEEEIRHSSQNTGQSNSARITKMNDTNENRARTLWGAMTLIVNGELQQAKQEAHKVANHGRVVEDHSTINTAGHIWTLAHHFQGIQDDLAMSKFTQVQAQASNATQLIQKIIGAETTLRVLGDRLMIATQGYTKKTEQGLQSTKAHENVNTETSKTIATEPAHNSLTSPRSTIKSGFVQIIFLVICFSSKSL